MTHPSPKTTDGGSAGGAGATVNPPSRRDDLSEYRREQFGHRPRAVIAFALGLALLALAVWITFREGQALREGVRALSSAPRWMLALALLLPLVNLLLATGSFWVLTNRHGRVRYPEMAGLIASAWLLNHLPLRPGMIGRVAYHKVVHGISIRSSISVLLTALLCAGVGMGTLLILAIVLHLYRASTPVVIAVLAAPPIACWVAAVILRSRRRAAWRLPAAVAFRYLDVCCWTARYILVFALLGRTVTIPAAAGIALSGQAAMLSPVQLGLREWLVGVAASIVPDAAGTRYFPTSVEALAPGLMIDLVNRAAELAVAVPLGTLATAVLVARFRRARALGRDDPGTARIPAPSSEPGVGSAL